MCDEMLIRRFAGVFVLLSVGLAVLVSPWWLALTAFVGLNLLQSSFSRFCPLERILGFVRVLGCSPAGQGSSSS